MSRIAESEQEMERLAPESPFEDLPEALVEEMLSHYKKLGDQLSASLDEIQSQKEKIRASLSSQNLLRTDSAIIRSHAYPTTCGVDGSYAMERLLSTDIAAMAGVAVEGLTPPSEKRHWPTPHHLCNVFTVAHREATALIIRAIMVTMELELASQAPHDVVFLDGSLTTPLIHLNQALARLGEVPDELSRVLLDRIGSALNNYAEILVSKRTDRIFAGVPKYTSRNEVSASLGLSKHEDRSLLSYILRGGELIGPSNMIKPEEDWHLSSMPAVLKDKANEIISAIYELSVLYYRPYDYFPALRIEVSPSVAKNQSRLSILLESFQLQCGAPGIVEPYPLYLADRMVKHLSTALPAIRKATTMEMASGPTQDVGSIFLAMQGYRTEY